MRDVRDRKRKGDERTRKGEEGRGGSDRLGYVPLPTSPKRDTAHDGTGDFRGGGWGEQGQRWEKRGDIPEKAEPRGKRNAKTEEGKTLVPVG